MRIGAHHADDEAHLVGLADRPKIRLELGELGERADRLAEQLVDVGAARAEVDPRARHVLGVLVLGGEQREQRANRALGRRLLLHRQPDLAARAHVAHRARRVAEHREGVRARAAQARAAQRAHDQRQCARLQDVRAMLRRDGEVGDGAKALRL